MKDGINTKCIIHHLRLSVDIYHEVRAHGHPLKPSEMTHSPRTLASINTAYKMDLFVDYEIHLQITHGP